VETFFPENQLVLILAKAAAGALFSLRLAGGTGDPVLLCAHGATVETEAGGRTAIRAGWSRAFSRHIGPGLDVGIEGSGILQSGSIYKVRAARQAGRGRTPGTLWALQHFMPLKPPRTDGVSSLQIMPNRKE